MVDVDAVQDALTIPQADEWAAFERLEPSTADRLHAQLSAIGGAVVYELRLVNWWLSLWFADSEGLQQMQPPSVPDQTDLDPLSPRDEVRPAKAAAKPKESDWVSPDVAAAEVKRFARG